MSTPVTTATQAPTATQGAAPNTATAPASAQPNPATAAQPAAKPAAKPAAAAAAKTSAQEQPKQPTAAEIRRLKLKLDGQDIELPEEEVVKLAQMSAVANRRFQEAAAEKKRTVEVLEFLKSNPKEAMKRLGIDIRKFSEETLTELLKQDMESPEAKRARELEDKVREYEAREKESQEAEENRRVQAEKQRIAEERMKQEQEIANHFQKQFMDALDKADVPKTAASVARMAQLQRVCVKNGYELDADAMAKIVSEDYRRDIQSRIEGMKNGEGKLDGDKIMGYFGDEVINAITKAKIAKLKGAKQKFSAPNEAQAAAQADKPVQSARGWKEFQRKSRGAKTY